MKIDGSKPIESLYVTDEKLSVVPIQPNNLILHLTNKTKLQIPINRDESYDKVIVRLFDKLVDVPGVLELFRREGVVLETEGEFKPTEETEVLDRLSKALEGAFPNEEIVWDSLEASKVKK